MLKKYPKNLHIGTELYTIKLVKKFDQPDVLGECDDTKKEIRILASLGSVEMFKTFLHELCHAVDFEYNLKLKHKQVYKLEEALLKLLVENFWGEK